MVKKGIVGSYSKCSTINYSLFSPSLPNLFKKRTIYLIDSKKIQKFER